MGHDKKFQNEQSMHPHQEVTLDCRQIGHCDWKMPQNHRLMAQDWSGGQKDHHQQ